MKRYVSMFLITILCFVLQTTIFTHLKIANVMPDLLIIVTATAGIMYGQKVGMFTGILSGLLIDLLYSNVVGIIILIFMFLGFFNGMTNKLYYKEDVTIPLTAIAVSDVVYGLLYFVFFFLLRGRLDFPNYLFHIILPEMIYTIVVGIILYKFIQWLDGKMYPPVEVPLARRQEYK